MMDTEGDKLGQEVTNLELRLYSQGWRWGWGSEGGLPAHCA